MMPIRKGDGTGLSVPGFSEVRTGDGTVLWSAGPDIPDNVVDLFEEQQYEDEGNTLSDFYDGDLSDHTRQQSTVLQGSYSLESSRGDNTNTYLTSLSGLNTYPSAGDSFEFLLRTGGGDDLNRVGFGVQDDASRFDAGYDILVSNAFDDFQIEVDGTDIASATPTINNNEQYRVEVTWGSGGTITAKLYDSTDTKVSEISGSDSTYTSGGIRWRVGRTGAETVYFDGYQSL